VLNKVTALNSQKHPYPNRVFALRRYGDEVSRVMALFNQAQPETAQK